MTREPDFSRSPRQRQRQREAGFYCALGFVIASAALAVMLHGWSIEADSMRLQNTTRMLQTERQQLQPKLAQVKALEVSIVAQHQHLESQFTQAAQRTFAPQVLHALASISPRHIRLHQIVVSTDSARIGGTASGQPQLQTLVETLKNSGLGQVRLQEMQQQQTRQENRQRPQEPFATPPLRYRFTLSLSAGTATITPEPPPKPSQPSTSGAAPAPRAKRT